MDRLRSGVSTGWNLCFQQTGRGITRAVRVRRGLSNSLYFSLGEWPRLPFTARIERPRFHRARSVRTLSQAGGAGCLGLCASNEGFLKPRVARARETPARSASLLLLALNRNVEGVSLPIDQQEGKIGWLNRIGQSLKHGKVDNRLTIEFHHHVARL